MLSYAGIGYVAGDATSTARSPVGIAHQPTFLTRESRDYNSARWLFNSRLDFHPALIATCRKENEIAAAVAHAGRNKLQVTVKSGGHSFEGFCSNNGGLMVNLSGMNQLSYDSRSHVLTAQPGCRLAQVSALLFSKGRLLPSGSCAGVGLAGLTLGGGYGLFARKFGLTCDHLIGLRMVDGRGIVHDSDDEPQRGAALLHACRGGGNGNFGIITEMRFNTVPAPKMFRSQRIKFRKLSPEKVGEIAKLWFAATAALPDDGFSAFVLNGTYLTLLVTFFEPGSRRAIEKAFKPLCEIAWKAEAIQVGPTENAVMRYYGRPGPLPFKNASAGYYRSYQDIGRAIPAIARQVAKVPGTVWQINTLGGQIGRADYAKQSVYPHRDYPWLGEIQAYWEKPARADACVENVAAIQTLLAASGVTAHYRNYPDVALKNWGTAYYGDAGLASIRAMKQRYDPGDIIRHPQSVKAHPG